MRADELYLAAQVKDALALDPRTAALGLDVKVIADRLFISGAASSEEQRAAIADVATEHASGLGVQNEVVVVPCDETNAAEDLE